MKTIKYFIHNLFKPKEEIVNCNKEENVNNKNINDESNKFEVEFTGRDSVKILTYNFFMRPFVSTNGDDHKYERLMDFLDELKDFDIVCFQEAFGYCTNRKDILIYEAAKRGFYYFYTHPVPSFNSIQSFDGGLLIISRFKIEEKEFYPYTYANDIDAIINKGLLYAKIKIKNQTLHLLTTHLQASYYHKSEEQLYINFITRKTQVEEMCYYLDKCLKKHVKNKDDKVLLMGDFNVPVGSKHDSLSAPIFKKFNSEYEYFLNELNSYPFYKTVDIYLTEKKEFPHTYGGNDPILNDPIDYDAKCTLDYIFELQCHLDFEFKDKNIEKEKISTKLKEGNLSTTNEKMKKPQLIIDYPSIKIQWFWVPKDKKDRKYLSLSDHAGLSIDLKLTEK